MRKETVIATILGMTLGIGIALFLIFVAKQKAIENQKVINPLLSPTIAVTGDKIISLSISAPENKSVAPKKTTTIKGKAEKNSLIVVESPLSIKTVKTETGDFSIDFPLMTGENLIKITAYENKNIDEKTLTIYYIEE